MTDVVRTDETNNGAHVDPVSHWVDRLVGRAPELTKSWGRYLAFVAVITIVAIMAVSIASSDTSLIVLGIFVAALAASLLARVFNLYD
jgi:fucose permease